MNSISVGIVGATGYTGLELMRLLVQHPAVELKIITSNSERSRALSEVFPGFDKNLNLQFVAHDSDQLRSCNLVFFATPHATAMQYVPALLDAGCKVIDLSADFRINDVHIWEKWYKQQHVCPELLKSAVYGLPEFNREKIRQARLVANPGCYPTAVTLGLLPAIKNSLINPIDIIVDAKSGMSGAGRKAALATQFSEVSESFKAYNVSGHRHLPEIMQTLNSAGSETDVRLTFVPHLVPMNRGIFATIYVKLNDHNIDMQTCYTEFYKQEKFVDIMPVASHPETKSVRGTNICQISFHPDRTGLRPAIILSVIDNLVKGAAGQAIQNMNLMFSLEESTGLAHLGFMP